MADERLCRCWCGCTAVLHDDAQLQPWQRQLARGLVPDLFRRCPDCRAGHDPMLDDVPQLPVVHRVPLCPCGHPASSTNMLGGCVHCACRAHVVARENRVV